MTLEPGDLVVQTSHGNPGIYMGLERLEGRQAPGLWHVVAWFVNGRVIYGRYLNVDRWLRRPCAS